MKLKITTQQPLNLEWIHLIDKGGQFNHIFMAKS